MNDDHYINHEVRIQVMEKAVLKIDEQFSQVHKEILDLMKQNFNFFLTTIGVILALFGGMILTKVFS